MTEEQKENYRDYYHRMAELDKPFVEPEENDFMESAFDIFILVLVLLIPILYFVLK